MSKQVEALLQERKGYVQRGLPERVAEVDEQLKVLGYSAKYLGSTPDEVALETAATGPAPETATVRRGRPPKRAQ